MISRSSKIFTSVSAKITFDRLSTILVVAMILFGFCQQILVTAFQNTLPLYFDDVAAGFVILLAAFVFIRQIVLHKLPQAFVYILFSLIGFSIALSIMIHPVEDGILQVRTVVFTFGLVMAGYSLAGFLNWNYIFLVVAILGIVTSTWMIIETILQIPLIDPSSAWLLQFGARGQNAMREGIPSSYYADGVIPGKVWFRAGGSFFNPPTAGFFLAISAFGFWSISSRKLRYIGWILIASALVLSVTRAGVLIFVFVTLIYWLRIKFGKLVALISLVISGAIAFFVFFSQGATATHTKGFFDSLIGLWYSPWGSGFDRGGWLGGYGDGSGISESYIGLLLHWMGIPILLALIMLVSTFIVALSSSSKQTILWSMFSLGFIVAAAVSETSSSLSGTSFGWLILGAALSRVHLGVPDDSVFQPSEKLAKHS